MPRHFFSAPRRSSTARKTKRNHRAGIAHRRLQCETLECRALLSVGATPGWAEFFGGTGIDIGYAVAVDAAGNAYVTGRATSSDFAANVPTVQGREYRGGNGDVFVVKVGADGAPQWKAFVGGSGFEYSQAIAVDSSGAIFIAGNTESADFPTPNGYDRSFANKWHYDAFVAKLTPDGQLAWGSYLGGDAGDAAVAIALDAAGNAFVTGWTRSSNFGQSSTSSPLGEGFDTSYNAGDRDGFVAKFTSSGQLAWSSYLGSPGYDYAWAVAADRQGNAYVTGHASSSDFAAGIPTVQGREYHGGNGDFFAVKLGADGAPQWKAFVGGTGYEYSRAIAVDASGAIFIAGNTESNNPESDFGQRRGGNYDAVVVKLKPSGELDWGSCLGGDGGDDAFGIALDAAGNAWVTGWTGSSNFPAASTNSQGFDTSPNGDRDGFLAKFTSSGQLDWGSYLGGTGYDHAWAIAAHPSGTVFVAGETTSTAFDSFPSISPYVQHAGGSDVFVAKIVDPLQAGFQGLGDLPGGAYQSAGYAVSGDGTTVVGYSESSPGRQAFRWTSSSGMVGLGDLPGDGYLSTAYAVSADGSVVAGSSGSSSGTQAFRWTQATGIVGLGALPGPGFYSDVSGHGISGDGTVIAGASGSWAAGSGTVEAYRWTPTTGMVGLGDLPGGGFYSNARVVSGNGLVIAGASDAAGSGVSSLGQAFRWTQATGMVPLSNVPATDELPLGASADGSVIVGIKGGGAFRWTQATGMVYLPGFQAMGVSYDGNVIVGFSPSAAVIWDAEHGLRNVKDVLTASSVNLDGWNLSRAMDISADGSVIVGYGTNPSGQTEAWIARLGRPALALTVRNARVEVNEGQQALNNGTWSDAPQDRQNVTLTASIGDVAKHDDGTWTWSYTPGDNTGQPPSVTITADDGKPNGVKSITFVLAVNNVSPTVDITGAPETIPEGTSIILGSTVTDPGTLDTFTYAWSVTKDGQPYHSNTATDRPTFTFAPNDNGKYGVSLVVRDDDGGASTDASTRTHNVIASIPGIVSSAGSSRVSDVALSPDGKKLYAAYWTDSAADPIGIYSTESYSLLGTMPYGRCHSTVAVSADARYIYAPSYYGGVSRFDSQDGYRRDDDELYAGSWPQIIALTPDGTKLVAIGGSDGNVAGNEALYLYDVSNGAFTTIRSIPFVGEPAGKIAISPDSRFAFVPTRSLGSGNSRLFRIALDGSEVSSVTLDTTRLAGAVFSIEANAVLISDLTAGKVWVVDPSLSSVGWFSVPNASASLTLTADGKGLYVLHLESGSISLVDVKTIDRTQRTARVSEAISNLRHPNHMTISRDGRRGYIAEDQNWGSPISGGITVVEIKPGGKDSISLNVTNVAPTVTIGGAPPTSPEGTTIALTSTVTDPSPVDQAAGFNYLWSLTKNGNPYPVPVPQVFPYPASFSFVPDDDGLYAVTLVVVDKDGAPSLPVTVSIPVGNIAPTMTVSGDETVAESSLFILTLGPVLDPGTDTVSQYAIHWGDGHDQIIAAADLPANRQVTHTYADGPSTPTLSVDLTDEDGTYLGVAGKSISVANVNPTAAFSNNGPVTYGEIATPIFSDALDPSSADTAAGLHYAYARSPDGFTGVTYANSSSDAQYDFRGLSAGDHTLYGRIIDKDDGFTQYSTMVRVDRKAASVTPDAASKTYGDPDPALTGTLGGFLAADHVTASYSRAAGETVLGGPYTISAALSPAEVLNNYDITYSTANFSIARAPLTITVDNKAREEGLPEPEFTGTIAGIKYNDPITATYATTATLTSPAGNYPITAMLNDPAGRLDNYVVTSSPGTLTVTSSAHSALSGMVWVDFNNNGEVDFGEKGIAGAAIHLQGTDILGRAVDQALETDSDGAYAFLDLRPGEYSITKQSVPAGYVDGLASVGTAGGRFDPVDKAFELIGLGRDQLAVNYNFGERPIAGVVETSGQSATIGFWQNNNGQALIRAFDGGGASTRLGDWLAATLPHIFGDYAGTQNLAGKTNDLVATAYQQRFVVKGIKLDAQLMATALAVYATSSSLGGPWAAGYGFKVTEYGLGYSTYNVGANGAAFGLADNTSVTVMDLLIAADSRAAGGVLFGGDAALRKMANTVFDGINTFGDLS